MMSLGVFKGSIKHNRHKPRKHAFKYPAMQVCLDIEQPELIDQASPFWSSKRFNLVRFDSQNYLPLSGGSSTSLAARVKACILEHTGNRFSGQSFLLANLSFWGHCFNPVSFFCCYESGDLRYLIAEVNNTPWGERFVYVCDLRAKKVRVDEQGYSHARFDKAFHVSPFMPMDLVYRWTFKISASHFYINMNLLEDEKSIFNAALDLSGQALTRSMANRLPFKYPFLSLSILSKIYWQAIKLFAKRIPVHAHPSSK